MSHGLSKLKVQKLLRQVATIEQHQELPDDRQPLERRVNPRERAFVRALEQRGKGSLTFRGGWPDFLVFEEGCGYAVEVKSRYDFISHAQAEMFEAMEALGITIYVWSDAKPKALTPWRKWPSAKRPPRNYPAWAKRWFRFKRRAS